MLREFGVINTESQFQGEAESIVLLTREMSMHDIKMRDV